MSSRKSATHRLQKKLLTKRPLEFFSNCRNPKSSHANIRGVALGRRGFARASIEATAAPRISRSLEGLLLGTPPLPGAEGGQLRAWKRSEMTKRTAKAKRARPKVLERREESASKEAARPGEGTHGEAASRAPSMRQRRHWYQRGTKKGRPTIRNLYEMSCPVVIPLHCVDYCNITRLP